MGDWTIKTLRADFLARMKAQRRQLDERERASSRANELALSNAKFQTDALKLVQDERYRTSENAIKLALDAIGERLEILNRLREGTMSRPEAMAMFQAMGKEIADLRQEIGRLRERASGTEGSTGGVRQNWSGIAAAIAAFTAIAAVALSLLRPTP